MTVIKMFVRWFVFREGFFTEFSNEMNEWIVRCVINDVDVRGYVDDEC